MLIIYGSFSGILCFILFLQETYLACVSDLKRVDSAFKLTVFMLTLCIVTKCSAVLQNAFASSEQAEDAKDFMNYINMVTDNLGLALITYIIYEMRKVKDIISSMGVL